MMVQEHLNFQMPLMKTPEQHITLPLKAQMKAITCQARSQGPVVCDSVTDALVKPVHNMQHQLAFHTNNDFFGQLTLRAHHDEHTKRWNKTCVCLLT